MNLSVHFDIAQHPRRARWFMAAAWAVIVVKCLLVWWAIDHWHVALNPWWVVGPTLGFAVLVTALWLTHHEE